MSNENEQGSLWPADVVFDVTYNEEEGRYELRASASLDGLEYVAKPVAFVTPPPKDYNGRIIGYFARSEIEALRDACNAALGERQEVEFAELLDKMLRMETALRTAHDWIWHPDEFNIISFIEDVLEGKEEVDSLWKCECCGAYGVEGPMGAPETGWGWGKRVDGRDGCRWLCPKCMERESSCQ